MKVLPGGGANNASELTRLLDLNAFADSLLEECFRDRLSLKATLARFLPAVCHKLEAVSAMVWTRNEEMRDELFEHGPWSEEDRAAIQRSQLKPSWRTLDGKRTVVAQPLDVAGDKVGAIAFSFLGDRSADVERLAARMDIVAEEFDGVLAQIQLAAFKQDLILRIGQALRNLVFDRGIDDAVSVLQSALPLRELVLLYHDDAATTVAIGTRYRIYREGLCIHDSETRPHPRLSELITRERESVLEHTRAKVQPALGMDGAIDRVLITGVTTTRTLGKILVTSTHGLSTFGHDLLQVFAESISQRLVDYNRERRHLSQFFSSQTINELLRDPAYDEKWLSPRTDEVALIYADINSFTKISEQVLKDPAKIGRFVDKWAAGAVDILFKHGGVFDKMVGDCIIGIFGPPFFRSDRRARVTSAMKAAREILAFTVSLEREAELMAIPQSGIVAGLGVAIGVNLCPSAVGLFGPNHEYTAFSSGMNATARLQSLAGFREILVMDGAKDALDLNDAGLKDATFEGPAESPVKNVAKPLRYYRVRFPGLGAKK